MRKKDFRAIRLDDGLGGTQETGHDGRELQATDFVDTDEIDAVYDHKWYTAWMEKLESCRDETSWKRRARSRSRRIS